MIPHRATLDVSRELAQYTGRLLRAGRLLRRTPKGSRALSCFWQAVLILRWFRGEHDVCKLARDHAISRATGYRYIHEGIHVLAAQAPGLHQALDRARADGLPCLILDGTVILTDRCREQTTSVKGRPIDVWYSGKVRHHGGNVQALFTPGGMPLWVSDVEPGSMHDLDAARIHALPGLYPHAARDLPVLADAGYEAAGIGIHTPVKHTGDGRPLDVGTRTRNALLRGLRCLGERGFALLTQRWRVLQRITVSPSRIGDIIKATLVLTHFEHGISLESH
ncbi:IS5/IS1182 family transposase [Spongiactinospora gelatinilytica]|uniref:IS5/IS1182 family transposase n=1 Tax=Spongiactinospora gelatinilytica TaxID=2666298 RepID=A0A2W2GJT6_9ACTN|nr:transposase family protein [Spongiactinospora gelatinilytica]PZG48841.1 IS5/IS1182 family transposase [Spongiactinospora gelatinilytica]